MMLTKVFFICNALIFISVMCQQSVCEGYGYDDEMDSNNNQDDVLLIQIESIHELSDNCKSCENGGEEEALKRDLNEAAIEIIDESDFDWEEAVKRLHANVEDSRPESILPPPQQFSLPISVPSPLVSSPLPLSPSSIYPPLPSIVTRAPSSTSSSSTTVPLSPTDIDNSDEQLQGASSAPNSPSSGGGSMLYDDDYDDRGALNGNAAYIPNSASTPNTVYDDNGNSGESGFEKPVLANGLLGWIGANVGAFTNYFSPNRDPESRLINEIAQANMEYVTGGLPQAVIEGLGEKRQREEEQLLLQMQLEEEMQREYERQQRMQQAQQGVNRLSMGPPGAEGQNLELLRRTNGVKSEMMDGMGVGNNIAAASNHQIDQSTQHLAQPAPALTPQQQFVRQQESVIDPNLPLQQQLYYQQLLYEQVRQHQQQTQQQGATMIGGMGVQQPNLNNQQLDIDVTSSKRAKREQRKLNRQVLASLFQEVATMAMHQQPNANNEQSRDQIYYDPPSQ